MLRESCYILALLGMLTNPCLTKSVMETEEDNLLDSEIELKDHITKYVLLFLCFHKKNLSSSIYLSYFRQMIEVGKDDRPFQRALSYSEFLMKYDHNLTKAEMRLGREVFKFYLDWKMLKDRVENKAH